MKVEGVLLTPEKAAIIDGKAVIADLHLGLENVMQDKGVAVPRMQIREIVAATRRLIEKYDVKTLIVAGDLKHEFSRNLPYEWEDVRTFVESVLELGVELLVVRGNHDNFLAAILAEYGIELAESLEVEDYCIVHGHRETDCERLIMGHEHPSVKVRVRGASYSFPCFLIADGTKIVLPAFSPLTPGSDILQGEFLSPILKAAKRIEVYAIEEEVFYLGTLEELRSVAETL